MSLRSGNSADELSLVVTCGLGLEEFVETELEQLGFAATERQQGAVRCQGSWQDCWRANFWLRTANRVLVELADYPAYDGDSLYQGAADFFASDRRIGGMSSQDLLRPERTLMIRASSNRSEVTDTRWIGLRTKDGLVDAQRKRYRKRSDIERRWPDIALRVWLQSDHATLLLDTSVEPLDRRGYRTQTVSAPVREQLAAACVLASGWQGGGPVVDPMCGSGTLLIEAAWFAARLAPGNLRKRWAFERFPSFDREAFQKIREAAQGANGQRPQLVGVDNDLEAVKACQNNMEQARLADTAKIRLGDAFEIEPPSEPGLVLINPAYGVRLEESPEQWRRLGDLLKQRFAGWTAVVLAGGGSRGKHIGLRPKRRIPVRNGPIDARILVFELY
jgi:putative N6-adenine-specific DNA methylase